MRNFNPRTIEVLMLLRAASGEKKHGLNRKQASEKMKLAQPLISSIFTRMERAGCIVRCGVSGGGINGGLLSFKITPEGIAAIKRGPGGRVDLAIKPHSGVYSKASPSTTRSVDSESNPKNLMRLPVYSVPPMEPARTGSNQHLNFKSKGF